ncbi:MAG: folylpolyglutamate synthase/dihydrofolate synthase family protein [Spirochaetota bacterium]
MKQRFTSMDAALDWLYAFVNYETRRTATYDPENYNLTRMQRLLDALGYTQTFRVLHIAGTKGKGSTAAAAERFLRADGKHTGLFTSPHCLDVRERIMVDGAMIPKREFMRLTGRAAGIVDTFPDAMKPTTFELFTALALMYFRERHVDWAVIEVGMGGRLDSTNVVMPDAVVITSLSFDHMDKLGSTLPEIAREKAGIIKTAAPVISAMQPTDALTVIRRTAEEHAAPLTVFGAGIVTVLKDISIDGTRFEYTSGSGLCVEIQTPLIGEFQMENLSLALRAVEIVLSPAERTIRRMARSVRDLSIRGRMNIVSREPLSIVDGAHNADSMRKVTAAIRAIAPGREFAVLFAPLLDKDIDGMCEALAGFTEHLIVTAPVSHKSADAHVSAEKARSYGFACEEISDFSQAMESLKSLQKSGYCTLITGSLYAVSSYFSMK